MDVVDIQNKSVKHFVDFAQRFCFNAPYLETGKSYQSDNGEFMIEYLPVITNHNGRVLTTPARISKVTGRIQVSKKQFDDYTVPMRFAILCHEFSHFYVNENMDDESEADINGLLIYLGLGYPRIEGYQAFLEVFKDAPNQNNKKRFDRIDNFIKLVGSLNQISLEEIQSQFRNLFLTFTGQADKISEVIDVAQTGGRPLGKRETSGDMGDAGEGIQTASAVVQAAGTKATLDAAKATEQFTKVSASNAAENYKVVQAVKEKV
jgi:hypothetical protein